MSGTLPALRATQVLAGLRCNGFDPIRQSGSHVVVKHPDGRWTTGPLHKGRDLPKGTLRQIMRDTGLIIQDLT
ncbi:MAG TPA: type II toxin-antitoxin system HicA family toxin [Chloroflexota bacterium]|nr:type II toxin-antitoxin system HicA family toxin [Chloroflexota bacterium]